MPENALFSSRTEGDEGLLFHPGASLWKTTPAVDIHRRWDGVFAVRQTDDNWSNETRVRSAWSRTRLFFYFEAWYKELNVNPEWSTETSIHGLWERDVVELFLQPATREDYFEIEASPLGQWLDVHVRKPRTDVNFGWKSRMALRVLLEKKEKIWRTFLALPFETLGEAGPPGPGWAWRLNLFRITGRPPHREYLAWRPTFTETPDFHKPGSFGYLFFLETQ